MQPKEYALVIGGTSGLGREIAVNLLRRGVTPIIMGRRVTRKQNWDWDLDGAELEYLDLTLINDSFGHGGEIEVVLDELLAGHHVTQVYWVSGIGQEDSFDDLNTDEVVTLDNVHFSGPMILLHHIIRNQYVEDRCFSLVVVSSTSAFRFREGEELYCALQAAKATFAVQIVGRLHKILPGSRVLLAMPGGMNTNFWNGRVDTSKFMDPKDVAKIIVDPVMNPAGYGYNEVGFLPIVIKRGQDGEPIVSYELPSLEMPRLL